MKYQVKDHDYMNTGGNCMVSTFTLLDTDNDTVVYLLVSEEGGSLSTADYINNEIDYDPSLQLGIFDITTLEVTDENFELYRDCWLEHMKRNCKHFCCYSYNVPWRILPKEYYDMLTVDDIAQLEERRQYCIIFNLEDGTLWID